MEKMTDMIKRYINVSLKTVCMLYVVANHRYTVAARPQGISRHSAPMQEAGQVLLTQVRPGLLLGLSRSPHSVPTLYHRRNPCDWSSASHIRWVTPAQASGVGSLYNW